jgi:hypothetical protein
LITASLTIDPNTPAATYTITLVDKDKRPLGSAGIAVLGTSASPIPPGLPPQVDVMWEVMSQSNCSDVFGRRIAQSEYCIQLVIGNNSGYPIQIAGIGFSSSVDRLFPKIPDVATSNSSYVSTRAVLLEQNVTSVRNIIYNSLQAGGVLMSAFTPYFGKGLHPATKAHPNGTVNNARTNWTTAASIVSGPLLSAFNIVAPNAVINQLNNLDDQSFRDNRIIANNSQIQTIVFVEKLALTDPLRALYVQLGGTGSCGRKTTNSAADQLNQVNCDFIKTIKNSKNPDQRFLGSGAKGKLNPLLVKLALGKVVIVGNQIEYLQRIQIQNNAASSSASSPLAATPGSLNFASLNGVTNGAAQSVTLTNNGSTPLTNVTPQLVGTSTGDFSFSPSTCPSPLTQSGICTLSVTYMPSPTAGADPRTATLQVSYSPGSTPLSIPLSGAASNTVYFSTTTALSFGTATVAKPAQAKLTITNFKATSITITPSLSAAAAITGPDNTLFKADSGCDATLAANTTCTVTVTFPNVPAGAATPAAGTHTATMTVTVKDPNGIILTQQVFSLTGTV